VLYLSLTPKPPKVDFEQSDKVGHFLSYGAMMLWFAFLYRRTPTRLAYAIGFIAMGIAIEFIQPYTGRNFELADMLADSIGVLLGWAAALLLGVRSRI
jgi:VanZ family protein